MEEIATFALGCFWHVEEYFSKLPGIISTVVGYTGGTKVNPTYEDLGDQAEGIQIKFDPVRISFEGLLMHFWQQHDPTVYSKRQYRSAIFTHNERQQALAEKSRDEEQKKHRNKVLTEIAPASTFYPAEAYHQKYLKKLLRVRGRC
jgi:peptide-methionine (S)-S-oxide reductase